MRMDKKPFSPTHEEENKKGEVKETSLAEQGAAPSTDTNDGARPLGAKNQELTDFVKETEEKKRREEKKKKRNWWIKTSLLLVLIGVSIYILFPITKGLSKEGTRGFAEMVKGANLYYFLLLIGVVLLYIVFESFQYSYILKTSTGKFRLRNSIKVAFLGKYYDAVTPLGTGGQPFQIYYLHKKDIPSGVATAVPIIKYTMATFAKGLVTIFFLSLTFIILPREVTSTGHFIALYAVAWVSMFCNMLVPIVMVFGSIFPKAGKKLIMGIIKVLAKMHIVKHKYKVAKKYVKEMSEYRNAFREILKQWWIVIPLLAICLIAVLINFSIPFFTSLALANTSPTGDLWLQMFCGGLIAYYAASLVPTPGNSGVIDITSALVFASVLNTVQGGAGGAVAAWVILVWRFFTFYVYVFAGVGINIFEIIRSAVRNRRAKKHQST